MESYQLNKIKFYMNTNAKNIKTGKLYLPLNINTLPKNIKKLNYFVKKIEKKKKYYSVTCCNNKKSIKIFTKKLVLGTGTISTTKLICESTPLFEHFGVQDFAYSAGYAFLLKRQENTASIMSVGHAQYHLVILHMYNEGF